MGGNKPHHPSQGVRSGIALDAFNGLVASVQTGFGPFVAVYLATEAWTQRDIGFALSVGTIAAMVSQLPGGAAVDAIANKRLAALVSCLAVAGAALLFALVPTRPGVFAAEILHGFASCMLGPAIAAVSLSLVGRKALGARLGRNGRYAAIGSGLAAAVMGAAGDWWGEVSVFWITAGLMAPALVALYFVRTPRRPHDPPPEAPVAAWRLMLDRRVLALALCFGLFTLANAAVLPQVGQALTRSLGSRASLVIAACIVVPQALVAVLSPAVGRMADRIGRRPLMLIAFAALPVRAALLAVVQNPYAVVAIQLLDGISAAGLGVLLPLMAADLTRRSGRFNLTMGALGLAAGTGATFSTAAAGLMGQAHGVGASLLLLAAIGAVATVAVAAFIRETRPGRKSLQPSGG